MAEKKKIEKLDFTKLLSGTAYTTPEKKALKDRMQTLGVETLDQFDNLPRSIAPEVIPGIDVYQFITAIHEQRKALEEPESKPPAPAAKSQAARLSSPQAKKD